ncbi:MAG: TetR family transcriptional regulator [Acidimicrobiales bacterium]
MTAADEAMRAADGRVPGRRGRATRDRLTACTLNMLEDTSYRDLKVVDIAREAGTSPATFYQYFPDVESAILALAEDMATDGNDRLTRIVREGDWKGRAAYDTAERIADAYISFWDDNSALMRVLDLTSLEGDQRFRSIRTRLLNEFTIALAGVVEEQQVAGKHPADLDPMAVAGVLVSMLAHVASHRSGFEGYDIRAADLRRAMARIVYTSVCGTKPPR